MLEEFSKVKGQAEPGENCAYNQTRECFLGLHVVAGDFPVASFQEWMATLTPNSGAGMWLVPFRGLAASDVTAPLDLLYLDAEDRVLEVVEFFPTFQVSPSCPPAASVLALPAHSIFSSQTHAGDQLILCPADEMAWRLDRLAGTGTMSHRTPGGFSRPGQGPALGPVLVRPLPGPVAAPAVTPDPPAQFVQPLPVPEERIAPRFEPAAVPVPPPAAPAAPGTIPAVVAPSAAQPVSPQPAATAAAAKPWLDPARLAGKSSRGWLGKLLLGDPGDPRFKARWKADGLVAHFFTGGAPQAHAVRDISTTGLYVVTKERWYPGTVIRMTLSVAAGDEHPLERSITVHARSVRWGNDGVGLEFILPESAKPGRGPASQGAEIDRQALDQFLKRHITAGR